MRAFRLVVLGSTVAASMALALPAWADPGDHLVTICHGAVDHYELITVDEHALKGHLDGTAPGHGWQNLPDVAPNADGTCGAVGTTGGGL